MANEKQDAFVAGTIETLKRIAKRDDAHIYFDSQSTVYFGKIDVYINKEPVFTLKYGNHDADDDTIKFHDANKHVLVLLREESQDLYKFLEEVHSAKSAQEELTDEAMVTGFLKQFDR